MQVTERSRVVLDKIAVWQLTLHHSRGRLRKCAIVLRQPSCPETREHVRGAEQENESTCKQNGHALAQAHFSPVLVFREMGCRVRDFNQSSARDRLIHRMRSQNCRHLHSVPRKFASPVCERDGCQTFAPGAGGLTVYFQQTTSS